MTPSETRAGAGLTDSHCSSGPPLARHGGTSTWGVPLKALRAHWPEYLMEGGLLGAFMVSACAFAALLEHPDSPVHRALPYPSLRPVLMGLAMGATLLLLIHSPWGRQSGAHMNPAVTLTFFRLGKVPAADAVFYALAQFAGGLAGVLLMAVLAGQAVAHPSVNHVATTPGPTGPAPAFAAEAVISFLLMLVVLRSSNAARWMRYTPFFAAALLATYIIVEAPISGTSMNPARSLGSAAWAGQWSHLWIYFTAPPLGMLLAAEAHLRLGKSREVFCAKLHHHNTRRCIFCLSREARNAEFGAHLELRLRATSKIVAPGASSASDPGSGIREVTTPDIATA